MRILLRHDGSCNMTARALKRMHAIGIGPCKRGNRTNKLILSATSSSHALVQILGSCKRVNCGICRSRGACMRPAGAPRPITVRKLTFLRPRARSVHFELAPVPRIG
jgi:hypothetical protein